MKSSDISQSPLNRALSSLELSIAQPLNEFTRDSVIQRFEYTLELSWKIAKKYLESQGIQTTTPKDVIREGAKAGILRNPERWMEFIEKRNLTSHTYNEAVATEVFNTAIQLPAEVKFLMQCLTRT
jgi:nucleotidyltransferase substrate binding protein (TIGR01987 family)